MAKRVSAILFDLDGTLYDRDGAMQELGAAQHRVFRASLGGVSSERYVERLLELDAHGHGDKRTIYAVLARELGLSDAVGEQLAEHHRQTFPGAGGAFHDVAPTLSELRARGLKLGLVTNGRVVGQEHKLRRLGLEPFFQAISISEREGMKKPERAIFERALAKLGIAASDAWHVGDHPMADVAGACAAGLTAIWRHVPYWPEPAGQACTIRTLGELIPLLDRGL